MDMNKSYVFKDGESRANWRLVDASGKVLGRLATEIADALRGKDKPEYTPHSDCGDYVVVVNCDKIVLTGNKWNGKIYATYSGYRSGLKEKTAKELFAKKPTDLIKLAVRGMLPKNKLNREVIGKLKLYVGSEHPHSAQLASN